MTGGTVITEEMGRKLDSTTLADLGQCDKVVTTKDDGGQGAAVLIRAHPAGA